MKVLFFVLMLTALLVIEPQAVAAENNTQANPPGPVLETLMRTQLNLVEGVEIIMSRVQVPPHSSLPRHTHPGEEFAYLLEGEVTYEQAGQPDRRVTAGTTVKVPINTVHTIQTGEKGATVIVFRVHPEGHPERILAD